MIHPLKLYRLERSIRQADMAKELEISASHLCTVENWQRRVSPDVAFKVEQHTKGAIKAVDLLRKLEDQN